ncbi:4-hydroxybenzoate polyprenyltransferase [Microbacterium testaceum]|jgi:hypothetical protein|uniref:4-hydroxybenzoate polyprenyltransferase n=2 Tax=Microbacterium testaceum TaxID=2033 RepID=A0A147FBW8_MICTE|nr:hypothetical protein [Microbacterium testaceum]MDF2667103.1 4-hydroxybenzoate polyprenyltransferase [Microbacterium sp.]KTR96686.1 4-hydroxybenzoate polyprenyltransferase [Microbacterium testaceum]KTS04973.1 4-hydroxybenzoate polyprenyltransferase [Microbacterium testaceum]KTS13982.1 4-hydroxybenzoate polyprenyltransferase [Microbacterium testaceum]KTS65379.1 4-hydroxybenzoate polyprenyltransferase [Microbacterium testaceum]
MTFASLLAHAAEEAGHHGGNVQAQTFWIGALAFVVFVSLSLVTLSYRNVSNRHAHKAEAYTKKHGTPTPEAHGH